MSNSIRERDGASLESLLRDYSTEVTPRDKKSIAAAGTMMAPGSEVFIASLPTEAAGRQVLAAAQLKRAGLTPVPHVVARNIKNLAELNSYLGALVNESGVDRVLLLAGDRDRPAGDFSASLQLLETGLIGKHGIRKIFLSWYPEGHPRIGNEALSAARAAKLAAAAEAGLQVTLLSQFCFASAPIIATAKLIRSEGVKLPLRVGVAGPASRASLLKYAMICGIGASMRALQERPAARSMLGDTPEDLLIDIARAQAENPALGITSVHFFTFASLASSVKFVEEHRRVGAAA